MLVSSVTTGQPRRAPIWIIACASAMACSSDGMKAPAPVLTSSTSPPSPSASFLLMMDAAISGMASTVAVASRRA